MSNQVVHHVFFWLNNMESKSDLDQLLEGLKTLKGIETVRGLHIGVPALTEKRDVIEDSYSASELIFFDDLEGEAIYQTHAIHQNFIKNYSHLWKKVLVYDSVDV